MLSRRYLIRLWAGGWFGIWRRSPFPNMIHFIDVKLEIQLLNMYNSGYLDMKNIQKQHKNLLF